jgi:uncharacterized membrane protein YccC
MKTIMKKQFIISLILAIAIGLIIAWIDTRPHWNDTGVTVFLVLLSALVCGYISSQKPWLISLAVSIWVPIFNIIIAHNYGALLALVPGFIGAYIGYLIRKTIITH